MERDMKSTNCAKLASVKFMFAPVCECQRSLLHEIFLINCILHVFGSCRDWDGTRLKLYIIPSISFMEENRNFINLKQKCIWWTNNPHPKCKKNKQYQTQQATANKVRQQQLASPMKYIKEKSPKSTVNKDCKAHQLFNTIPKLL